MDQFLKLLESLNLSDVLNYELINEALISHHSTAIEGSSLTVEETILLLTEGITAKGKPVVHHNMVTDHQAALEWILEQAKSKRDVTPEFIQKLSSLVLKTTGGIINAMAGSYDSSKGDFRKSNVYVGPRYFLSYQKVEQAVSEFERYDRDKKYNDLDYIYLVDKKADGGFESVFMHIENMGTVQRELWDEYKETIPNTFTEKTEGGITRIGWF
ncbi:MAG: hypothetical protein LBU84_17140 [Prevotella sp.]|jgi:Fic family protein|nr:hypothetical protein [Prevotella sp.]